MLNKKFITLGVAFFILGNVAFSLDIQKDGTYVCKYPIDKYSFAESIFIINKSGDFTSTMSAYNSPSIESLISNGKCTFTPNKHYKCEYKSGSCNVTIMPKGGHEVSCLGNTPDTETVYKDSLGGKCKQ